MAKLHFPLAEPNETLFITIQKLFPVLSTLSEKNIPAEGLSMAISMLPSFLTKMKKLQIASENKYREMLDKKIQELIDADAASASPVLPASMNRKDFLKWIRDEVLAPQSNELASAFEREIFASSLRGEKKTTLFEALAGIQQTMSGEKREKTMKEHLWDYQKKMLDLGLIPPEILNDVFNLLREKLLKSKPKIGSKEKIKELFLAEIIPFLTAELDNFANSLFEQGQSETESPKFFKEQIIQNRRAFSNEISDKWTSLAQDVEENRKAAIPEMRRKLFAKVVCAEKSKEDGEDEKKQKEAVFVSSGDYVLPAPGRTEYQVQGTRSTVKVNFEIQEFQPPSSDPAAAPMPVEKKLAKMKIAFSGHFRELNLKEKAKLAAKVVLGHMLEQLEAKDSKYFCNISISDRVYVMTFVKELMSLGGADLLDKVMISGFKVSEERSMMAELRKVEREFREAGQFPNKEYQSNKNADANQKNIQDDVSGQIPFLRRVR